MIFGFIEKEVQVGLAPYMSDAQKHGTVTDITGQKLPFTVDHPNRLKRPSMYAVSKMFKQFEVFGIHPTRLELHTGRTNSVYRLERGNPVLVAVTPSKR